MDSPDDGGVMLAQRMTPSQYIANRVGSDAETICALLSDIQTLQARVSELEARLADISKDATAEGAT